MQAVSSAECLYLQSVLCVGLVLQKVNVQSCQFGLHYIDLQSLLLSGLLGPALVPADVLDQGENFFLLDGLEADIFIGDASGNKAVSTIHHEIKPRLLPDPLQKDFGIAV